MAEPAQAVTVNSSQNTQNPSPVERKRLSLKPFLILGLLALFLAAIFLLNKYLYFQQGRLRVGQRAAVVNGQTISKQEFDKRLADQKYFYSNISKLSDEEFAKLDEKVREEMIMEILLTNFLKENGIEVSNEEVRAKLKTEVVDRLFGGDWSKYEAELHNRYKTTLEQVIRTERIEILKGKLGQLQTTKHFLGIWVAKDMPQFARTEDLTPSGKAKLEKANASKKQKADAALKRIQAGEDFSKVAGEVSEDQVSSVKGGDLGFIYLPKNTPNKQDSLEAFSGKSAIISNFDQMKKGDLKLVEILSGYVILKVLDVKEGPLEDNTFEEWYSLYREQAGVKIYE